MGSHSVTCHPTQVNTPRLTPNRDRYDRFTYPGGTEGWVDLDDHRTETQELKQNNYFTPADVKRNLYKIVETTLKYFGNSLAT